MNFLRQLDTEKKQRLLAKEVLPSTFFGGGYDKTPTFPHLFSPIGQPFRYYQGIFGSSNYEGSKCNAARVAEEFYKCVVNATSVMNINSQSNSAAAKHSLQELQLSHAYCFFLDNNTVYFVYAFS